MHWWHRLPLDAVYAALTLGYMLAAAALALLLTRWLQPWAAVALSVALPLPLLLYHVRRVFAPARSLFRALAGSVANYRDGDYSSGVSWQGRGGLRELVDSHNQLGKVLREQRQSLVQRELLLDTVVQNTPVAMLLVDAARRVVLGNLAARSQQDHRWPTSRSDPCPDDWRFRCHSARCPRSGLSAAGTPRWHHPCRSRHGRQRPAPASSD